MSAISKFQSLPLDIISLIVDDLNRYDRRSLRFTCRGLYDFIPPSDDLHFSAPKSRAGVGRLCLAETKALEQTLETLDANRDFSQRIVSVSINMRITGPSSLSKGRIMDRLGRLPNLERLKTSGTIWPDFGLQITTGGFPKLELLYVDCRYVKFRGGVLRSCLPALETICFKDSVLSLQENDKDKVMLLSPRIKNPYTRSSIAATNLRRRIEMFFEQYEDGMALSWADTRRVYKRMTHAYPQGKEGDGVYPLSPFRGTVRLAVSSEGYTLGPLTQDDIDVMRGQPRYTDSAYRALLMRIADSSEL